MTAKQKFLVQVSFKTVASSADAAGTLFYERLFTLDPSLRQLFPSDLQNQKRKLMQALALAVESLDRMDQLTPLLEDMGRRHVGYGVTAEHYDTVGAALLWTLEQALGKTFNEELRDAWNAAYRTVNEAMQKGATVPSSGISVA